MNPKKKIFGLIGYPVKHSLSPLMHNAAFKKLGIAAEYKLFKVRPAGLNNFLKSLSQRNIYGLNVTIPHKERVIAFLDSLSEEARLIGAVNTLKVTGEGLEGFNTDGAGFLRHLKEDLGFNPQDKDIAIIGAGGAAKAVSVYLGREKPKSISIYDIDKNKTEALVRHLKDNFNNVEFKQVRSIEGLGIENSNLLINATGVGMKESDPCLVGENLFHHDLLVYDLIYNPKETELLKIAKKKDARISNGLGMLLYQGILAFEIWTGCKAPVEVMRQALRDTL